MARSKSRGLRPSLEGLELRVVLSASSPVNVIGAKFGTVSLPRQINKTSAIVDVENLTPRRRDTTFALFVKPTAGSVLLPRIASSTADQGKVLPLQRGRVAGMGTNQTTVAFTRSDQAGALTTGVTGAGGTTGSYGATTTLVGDVNGDGAVDLADLQAFAPTYMSKRGGPDYLASADFNQNGVVNLYDAKAILQNMAPLTRKIPLSVSVHLAPGDQPRYDAPTTSGASTQFRQVTIVGRTTPGSLIIEDVPQEGQLPGGSQSYKFTGAAHATDAKGFFSFQTQEPNREGLNNNDLLILDPFGNQLIRALPVFWIPYAAGRI